MSINFHSLVANDADIYFLVCWCIVALSIYFVITTIIYFCCTSWYDPNLPNPKNSKQYKYFINAHMYRVLYLIIAVIDMTCEQFADEIVTYNNVSQRILRYDISCNISARVRTGLFVVALYFYGMHALFLTYNIPNQFEFTLYSHIIIVNSNVLLV